MSQTHLTKFLYKLTFGAAVLLFATSCASTGEIDQIRQMAEQAQQAAEQARSEAGSANDKASEALSTARAADRKASEAERKAESAQTCCEENRERLDRMFEKAQQK